MKGESAELLQETYVPYEALPKLLDPPHGYLFNTNNTPFNSAHKADNLQESDFTDFQFGFKESENNRSARFMQLMESKKSQPENRQRCDQRYNGKEHAEPQPPRLGTTAIDDAS